MDCYCGSKKSFKECCEGYILKTKSAPNPESLMRSRYTAFILKNMDYILETHDLQTRDQFDRKSNLEWAESSQFNSLEIIRTETIENKGIVEFRVTYTDLKSNKIEIHHEVSKFRKQKEIWYFREGKILNRKE